MSTQKTKQYSWSELAKHNTAEDCWVAVDGKVYDVTKWVNQHPGGSDIILYSSGRDVTNLFESYHPMSDKPAAILEKYHIGTVSSLEFPKYVVKSKFYDTLKARVRKHFIDTAQDPQQSVGVVNRIILAYVIVISGYVLSHYVFQNFYLNFLLAIVFGVCEALFAMHLLHDASHCAVGHNPKVWKWLGASFDFVIGGSFFAWIHQHVLGHHLYTNVRGADPDVGDGEIDFRVITPYQQRLWYHKYQHIYAPLLYGLYPFKTRIQDSESFIKKINGRIRVSAPSTFDLVAYIVGKISFIFFRFILPLQYIPYANLIPCFIIAELTFGWYLTINFQVSHVAEDLKFFATESRPNEPTNVDEDWAISQVKTTQDYANGSLLANYFSGALNHQVVHHLFPSIQQEFLPQIVPILKQVCSEYNLKYNHYDTFTEAIGSHIKYLYKMGNDPDYVQIPVGNV
ncbi:delta 5 fatty acid desaturase [Cavenderia fasciculata]|uniref:Delta 5 fatty acid desaturase n=1 Tax=Cavenderia fasciculata TaxID=261658 RepID=F4PX93_CACFS|nr:delta 5 fatty acid desaturase [Cavenderia fasciculata]EGG19896.1 delta 5 fatty acid desaturase [Cavenderia fasciculata]|eukprot:XP_004366879.1 delta 5 fatty acid desaturase [Cavenderia fasciculata]